MRRRKKTMGLLWGVVGLLLLGCAGCSSEAEKVAETHFSQYNATEESDEYQVAGTIYQSAEEDGVLFYIQPLLDQRLHLEGTMTQQQGNLQLVYVAPDGSETVLHDSRNGSDESVIVDFSAVTGIGSIRFLGENGIFDFDLTLTGFSTDSMAYIGGKLPALHETKGTLPFTPKEEQEKTKQEAALVAAPQQTEQQAELGPLPQMEDGKVLAEVQELRTQTGSEQTVLSLELEEETPVVLEAELYANQTGDVSEVTEVWLEARMADGAVLPLLQSSAKDDQGQTHEWRGKYHHAVTLPKGVTEFVLSPIEGESTQVGLTLTVDEGE